MIIKAMLNTWSSFFRLSVTTRPPTRQTSAKTPRVALRKSARRMYSLSLFILVFRFTEMLALLLLATLLPTRLAIDCLMEVRLIVKLPTLAVLAGCGRLRALLRSCSLAALLAVTQAKLNWLL